MYDVKNWLSVENPQAIRIDDERLHALAGQTESSPEEVAELTYLVAGLAVAIMARQGYTPEQIKQCFKWQTNRVLKRLNRFDPSRGDALNWFRSAIEWSLSNGKVKPPTINRSNLGLHTHIRNSKIKEGVEDE